MDAKNQQDRAKMVEEAVGRMCHGRCDSGRHDYPVCDIR